MRKTIARNSWNFVLFEGGDVTQGAEPRKHSKMRRTWARAMVTRNRRCERYMSKSKLHPRCEVRPGNGLGVRERAAIGMMSRNAMATRNRGGKRYMSKSKLRPRCDVRPGNGLGACGVHVRGCTPARFASSVFWSFKRRGGDAQRGEANC